MFLAPLIIITFILNFIICFYFSKIKYNRRVTSQIIVIIILIIFCISLITDTYKDKSFISTLIFMTGLHIGMLFRLKKEEKDKEKLFYKCRSTSYLRENKINKALKTNFTERVSSANIKFSYDENELPFIEITNIIHKDENKYKDFSILPKYFNRDSIKCVSERYYDRDFYSLWFNLLLFIDPNISYSNAIEIKNIVYSINKKDDFLELIENQIEKNKKLLEEI